MMSFPVERRVLARLACAVILLAGPGGTSGYASVLSASRTTVTGAPAVPVMGLSAHLPISVQSAAGMSPAHGTVPLLPVLPATPILAAARGAFAAPINPSPIDVIRSPDAEISAKADALNVMFEAAAPAPADDVVAPWPGSGDAGGPAATISVAKSERRLMSTRVVIGPTTLELSVGREPNILDRLTGIVDRQKRQDIYQAHDRVSDLDLSLILDSPVNPDYMEDRKPAEAYKQYQDAIELKVEKLKVSFPAILREQFESTLSHYSHSVEEQGELKIYSIPRGLEFWIEFISSPDLDKRVVATAFLSGRRGANDAASRIVRGAISARSYESRALDAEKLSAAEREAVMKLADRYKLNVGRQGPYMQIGGGMSFHILHRVFVEAQKLVDPMLIARFNRVMRFLSATGIGVINHGHQGAAAYYTPAGDEMAYVMPSRGDLDTTVHELNHARFNRFEKRLAGWLRAKGYAMPYEVDGPAIGLFGLGAFMNLLNELNSWRMGDSFGDKFSDAKILQILRRGYGAQAGWNNVRYFSKIWSSEAVAGKSVPRLILDSARALNGIDNRGLSRLGQEALLSNDVIKAHNFLRLIGARYPDLKGLSAERKRVLRKFTAHADKGVARAARRLLKVEEKKSTDSSDAENIESELRDILDEKVKRRVKEKQLVKIVRSALREDDEKSVGRQARALKLLKVLFEKWGWEPLREEGGENRPAQPGHLFFSKAIDDLLARGLFDGSRSHHRLPFINNIVAYTYPQELPQLRRRVLRVIASNKKNEGDYWLARMFLVPDDLSMLHIAWGEAIVQAVQNDKTPAVAALEFAGEFYRTELGASLPGDGWGQSPEIHLNHNARLKAEANLAKMSMLQRERYDRALEHLWFMLGHGDEKVRISARYAIASYPGYLVGVEDKIVQRLKAPASGLRLEVVSLAAMTDKGFLPKVDALLETVFSPTAQESDLLNLRR